MIAIPARPAAPASTWTPAERRTLGAVLGFVTGLALGGPLAALALAAAGRWIGHFVDFG